MREHQNLPDFARALANLLRDEGRRLGPPDHPSDAAGFNHLALDLFRLQVAHNPAYARFCRARRIQPEQLTRWEEIPAMPCVGFKELELTCLARNQRTTAFFSSGTTREQPSRHFHSAESLALYEDSLWPWFQAHLLPETDPARPPRFLCLSPPPSQAPHSSLVHMFDTVRRRLPSASFVFCGTCQAESAWTIHLDQACADLAAAAGRQQPVVLLGTAFLFVHLLDGLAGRGLTFTLPDRSRLMETGGYKGQSRALPKAQLHRRLSQALGIPSEHIVCEYGMTELSSQAYDSGSSSSAASRLFRFPPWARARIVSPEHGREVGIGEAGLIQVFDLANVYSVLAVQTEDLAVRRENGFELVGRPARAPHRGCSLMTP